MCGSEGSSWPLKIPQLCVWVGGIHIQKTTEPITEWIPAAGTPHLTFPNLPDLSLHMDPVLWDSFTSVLPLPYKIFSFLVVFKSFFSNRSKEGTFWRSDNFSVNIFLKPYGLHFLKKKGIQFTFLNCLLSKKKDKEKMQKHLFLSFLESAGDI